MTEQEFNAQLIRRSIRDLDALIQQDRARYWQPIAGLVMTIPFCFLDRLFFLALIMWGVCIYLQRSGTKVHERTRAEFQNTLEENQ